uniref:Uncharacterized protein n=1 Tax=Salix viminalis TaxID=40686 RepID=A0A6N2L9U3_SALVM
MGVRSSSPSSPLTICHHTHPAIHVWNGIHVTTRSPLYVSSCGKDQIRESVSISRGARVHMGPPLLEPEEEVNNVSLSQPRTTSQHLSFPPSPRNLAL